jgi:hypothetical protein
MATDAQLKWLTDLLVDCGFGDRAQRNAYLSSELGREIKYLDDLKIHEASKLIDVLRELKDERRGS